jgi:CheY-like chemotaxis protein
MSGETVLLVEDNDALRALGRHVLQAGGYTALGAADGARALDVSARHPGPIDLLVTDVSLPGMGGRQLAQSLLRLRPGLRVLYLSGDPDEAARGGAFLAKPFTPDALEGKAREVLGGPG